MEGRTVELSECMRTEKVKKILGFIYITLKFNKTFRHTYITSKTFFTKQAIRQGCGRPFWVFLSREISSAKFVADFFQLVENVFWKLSAKPQSSEAVKSLRKYNILH